MNGELPTEWIVKKKEVVLTWLRIGHFYATHSYLLKGEEQRKCIPCDTPFTIKHVLLYCVDFENTRNRYYRVSTLKELLESVEISNIFEDSKTQIRLTRPKYKYSGFKQKLVFGIQGVGGWGYTPTYEPRQANLCLRAFCHDKC